MSDGMNITICLKCQTAFDSMKGFPNSDIKFVLWLIIFLPDVNKLTALDCPYETRLLYPEDFKDLYIKEWSNAICADRMLLDMLCIGAYDAGKLIGLAGCSADCEDMWQIGVDVLPEYRRQGIASALTSKLAVENLKRDKVPFYCCAWLNISSAKNAIKSGFVPAWAEMTVKPSKIVDEINNKSESEK